MQTLSPWVSRHKCLSFPSKPSTPGQGSPPCPHESPHKRNNSHHSGAGCQERTDGRGKPPLKQIILRMFSFRPTFPEQLLSSFTGKANTLTLSNVFRFFAPPRPTSAHPSGSVSLHVENWKPILRKAKKKFYLIPHCRRYDGRPSN